MGRKREGKDQLDLLPPEKFPSYASDFSKFEDRTACSHSLTIARIHRLKFVMARMTLTSE